MNDKESQAIAIAKERKRDQQTKMRPELSRVELEEVSKDHLGAVGVLALVIGIWGLAALIAALFNIGGPVALLNSWFEAVTGM